MDTKPKVKCAQCGVEFEWTLSRPRKFCSQRCYWDNKKGQPCAPGMGTAEAGKKGGSTGRGRPHSPEHVEKRIAATMRTVASQVRICKHCGGEFTPTSPAQRYCSGQCWNAVARKKKKRLHRISVTPKQYEKLLERFGNACGICGATNGKHRLAVDHVHGTQQIRGLLCHRCNTALGLMKDSPRLLEAARRYLTNSA